MPTFTTVATLPNPPEAVFGFIIDLSQWSRFKGYGPLPGIVSARVPEGGAVGLGVAIEVHNTDGSVHRERVTAFEPGRRYAVRMELTPPASTLMKWIDEEIVLEPQAGGTRMARTFTTVPRAWYTFPFVWLMTHLLLVNAVRRHDADVAAAAR